MVRIFEKRWFGALAFVVITAAVFAAYSGGMHTAFQFDGIPQIAENNTIRDLGNLAGILSGNRPVTVLTFAFNYAAGGLDTFGYHLVNVFIHAANAFLAYLLVSGVLGLCGAPLARSRRIAFFSALVFALHPIQTQAVTYVIQRMELLGSLFYLASVLLFARGAVLSGEGRRRAAFIFYALTVASYCLGFYSKEVVITLPVVIFLFDILFVSNLSLRPLARRVPLYAVLVVLMCWFAYATISPGAGFGDVSSESVVAGAGAVASPGAPGAVAPLPQRLVKGPSAGFGVATITPGEYLMTQFNVLAYYMSLLLYPANQNIDYDFPVSTSLFFAPATPPGTRLNYPLPPPAVSLAVLLVILAAAAWPIVRATGAGAGGPGGVRAATTAVAVSFFILWFFLILAPTSSIVPIYDVIFEHRLYLPSLGFITAALLLADAAIDRAFNLSRVAAPATDA